MTNHERIKLAFGDVKAPKGFADSILKPQENITQINTQRTGKRRLSRVLIIAAAVCLALGFTITAIATNFFGLRDTVIPGTDDTITHEWPDGTVVEYQQQLISLQGFAGSPEHAAAVEWQEFVDSYDLEALFAIIGNLWIEEIPEIYQSYGAYSLEMAYKLYEIAEKHGLSLRGEWLDIHTQEELQESIARGPIFSDDSISYIGYKYESGTFMLDTSYGEVGFQFRANRKGVFDEVYLNIGNIDDYTEWSYENTYGTQLILSQSSHKSLVIAETDDFFFTINILAGTEGDAWDLSGIPFAKNDLESFVDLIDFGQIRTDLPALVRYEFPASITQEMIEEERSKILAKRAELDAEREYNTAIISDLVGMWSYIGSEDANGAVTPMFYNEVMMVTEDMRAFFWSGEGVFEQQFRVVIAEPESGKRFFAGELTVVENEGFHVSNGGFWNYTDEEISYDTADWDSMRLKFDPASGFARFTDWHGIHHFYEKESDTALDWE